MALESRSRMISFRLTDEEYDRFRNLCFSRGLRNVSELVRAAVNQLMSDGNFQSAPSTTSDLLDRVASLESRLDDLSTAVVQIEGRVSSKRLNHSDAGDFVQAATGQ